MDRSWANVSEWCAQAWGCIPTDERWRFTEDMNRDGSFTITDVFQMLGYAFHAPGDGLIYAVMSYTPRASAFLEISADYYGGFISLVSSLIAWGLVGAISD
jgi:hypothetical protein